MSEPVNLIPPGERVAGLHDWERHIYDDVDAINWSSLKPFDVPQKAKWMQEHPEDADTEALAFGRMAHLLVLQPEIFYQNYVETPTWPHGGGHLRMVPGKTTKDEGKLNKIEKTAWEAEHKDQEWIDSAEWKKLHQMKEALEADDVTGGILTYPYWKKEVTCLSKLNSGEWTKSMFDMRGELDTAEAQMMFHREDVEGGVWHVDYKTARSAAPGRFDRWSVRDYGYIGQGAFSCDNDERANGVRPAGFAFMVQDKFNGYTPCVYLMTPGQFKQGTRDWQRLLQVKRTCEQTKRYPGYASTALYLADF